MFSFCQFCDVAKVVITQRKDLDKFGYKLNKRFLKKKFLKNIFGYLLEPCREIWQFFLNFDHILATENIF
jgi:hypothetical protein